MPVTPDAPVANAHARPPLTTRGLKPTDINPEEMDDVIMRIFKELRKQLSIMEAKTTAELEPPDRERHARILASLEHTMERLVKLEAGRAAARKNKIGTGDGYGGRKALETRIDRIITIEFEKAARQKTEQSPG